MRKNILLLVFLLSGLHGFGQLELASIFSDNMVLQRELLTTIWGTSASGEVVTLTFNGDKYSTVASNNGEWSIKLDPENAGGPYSMLVATKEEQVEIKNILVGDVWICSGQSNMEFQMAKVQNAYEEIRQSNYDKIRILNVERAYSNKPQKDINGEKWQVSSPETISNFSAVGYFFGRNVVEEMDVPIGLISSSWGGATIEAFMDSLSLSQYPEFMEVLADISVNDMYIEEKQQEFKVKDKPEWLDLLYSVDPGFDSAGGLNSGFFADFTEYMELPNYWEDKGFEYYDGTMWFKKKFDLPESFTDKDVLLQLGWVSDVDITFINGHKVGSQAYRGTNRRYTIKKEWLKPEGNEILVMVYDKGWKGGFWGSDRMFLTIDSFDNLLKYDLEGDWLFKTGFEMNKSNDIGLARNPSPRAVPTFLYNAMIHPLTTINIKGVLWYQGESNTGRPKQYEQLFNSMIFSWRNYWRAEDLPFLYVQLSSYGDVSIGYERSKWAETREAQSKALKLKNTGMAVTADIGKADDIHPTNKQDVGERLSRIALNKVYGLETEYSGPVYSGMNSQGNTIELSFELYGSDLTCNNEYGYLEGFAIAGEDKEFVWAKAYIKDNKVYVYSDSIKNPVAVRYNWSDDALQGNLYNVAGFPASGFRTDAWE